MPKKKVVGKKYVLDNQVGFMLRVAAQFHTAIFTARMIDGLTQTQFATVAKLHEVGVCSQSDLGRTLVLDSATVNGVTDRLYARGFINIVADPNDRRRQWISLSKKGVQTIEKAQAVAFEISQETTAALTEAEHARLIHLLRKMIGTKAPSRQEIRSAARTKPSKPLLPPPMKRRDRPRLLRRASPE
jgi:MarR family transcriptional regulator, lower aerobic nicotinate degradation pathway regulator